MRCFISSISQIICENTIRLAATTAIVYASKPVVASFPINQSCGDSGCVFVLAGLVNTAIPMAGSYGVSLIHYDNSNNTRFSHIAKTIGPSLIINTISALSYLKIGFSIVPIAAIINLTIGEIYKENVFLGLGSLQGLSGSLFALVSYRGPNLNSLPLYWIALGAIQVGGAIAKNNSYFQFFKDHIHGLSGLLLFSTWSAAALGGLSGASESSFAAAFYEATTVSLLSLSSLTVCIGGGFVVSKLAEKVANLECVQHGLNTISNYCYRGWSYLKSKICGPERQPQVQIV